MGADPLYSITVTHEFCAAHTLTIAGQREPVHGHNFVTQATVAGDTLDEDGLLCDFHAVEAALVAICGPFANRNLNDTPPFDTTNPSAELIARHIGDELARRLEGVLPAGARVQSVSVTEAPGCVAVYRRG